MRWNSRGAATECSPGREPGVSFRHDFSPGVAKESFQNLSPLRGFVEKLNRAAGPDLAECGIGLVDLERRTDFLVLKEIYKRRVEKMMRGRRDQHERKLLRQLRIRKPILTRRNVGRQRVEVLQALRIELAFS